jgi:hypothetical protein
LKQREVTRNNCNTEAAVAAVVNISNKQIKPTIIQIYVAKFFPIKINTYINYNSHQTKQTKKNNNKEKSVYFGGLWSHALVPLFLFSIFFCCCMLLRGHFFIKFFSFSLFLLFWFRFANSNRKKNFFFIFLLSLADYLGVLLCFRLHKLCELNKIISIEIEVERRRLITKKIQIIKRILTYE